MYIMWGVRGGLLKKNSGKQIAIWRRLLGTRDAVDNSNRPGRTGSQSVSQSVC